MQVVTERLPMTPVTGKKFKCAFFNYSAQGANQTTGGWSYSGVETDVINTTHVRCIASHLTSFAVLVSIAPTVGDTVSGDNYIYAVGTLEWNCNIVSIIHFSCLYAVLFLQPALNYITYIGCSVSFLCLLASIIFFISLR